MGREPDSDGEIAVIVASLLEVVERNKEHRECRSHRIIGRNLIAECHSVCGYPLSIVVFSGEITSSLYHVRMNTPDEILTQFPYLAVTCYRLDAKIITGGESVIPPYY